MPNKKIQDLNGGTPTASIVDDTYWLAGVKDPTGTPIDIPIPVSLFGGGLTFFTETENTASPNATVPVNALTVVSAAANADFAIIAKGAGAIVAAIPNGTATGGNKRGNYAIDFGLFRTAASQIANGDYSAQIAGRNLTTSGYTAATIGGDSCINSGQGAFIAAGNTNIASGAYGFVSGFKCESNHFGAVSQGRYAASKYQYSYNFASQRLTATGDAQYVKACLLATTTDATPKVMTSDLLVAGTANQISATGKRTAFGIRGNLVGVLDGIPAGTMATSKVYANNFYIVGTIDSTGVPDIAVVNEQEFIGSEMIGCDLTFAGVTQILQFKVTGVATKNINWHLVLDINMVED